MYPDTICLEMSAVSVISHVVRKKIPDRRVQEAGGGAEFDLTVPQHLGTVVSSIAAKSLAAGARHVTTLEQEV